MAEQISIRRTPPIWLAHKKIYSKASSVLPISGGMQKHFLKNASQNFGSSHAWRWKNPRFFPPRIFITSSALSRLGFGWQFGLTFPGPEAHGKSPEVFVEIPSPFWNQEHTAREEVNIEILNWPFTRMFFLFRPGWRWLYTFFSPSNMADLRSCWQPCGLIYWNSTWNQAKISAFPSLDNHNFALHLSGVHFKRSKLSSQAELGDEDLGHREEEHVGRTYPGAAGRSQIRLRHPEISWNLIIKLHFKGTTKKWI